MVGVPRSRGCRICVQRRVRCDGARPTCNNCKKGDRPCPGYDQGVKFQDETQKLHDRYQKKQKTGDRLTAPRSTPSDRHSQSADGSPQTWETTTTTTTSGSSPESELAEIVSRTLSPVGSSASATSRPSAHWDVVGLDIATTNRRTFLGLLEGKSDVYRQVEYDYEWQADDAEGNLDIDRDDDDDGTLLDNDDDLDFSDDQRTIIKSLARRHRDPELFDASKITFAQGFRLNTPIWSPNTVQDQIFSVFSNSLSPPNFTNGRENLAAAKHYNWLKYIPPLTGTNNLLDTAVRAVSLVHIGRLQGSELFISESRPYYGRALRLLNDALGDPTRGTSDETLCATMLLSFYEMFASSSRTSWIRHAGGAGALMKARGPRSHLRGFAREIYLAYRFTLIIEAFERDMPCFLEEPGWQEMSHRIHDDIRNEGVPAARMNIFDRSEEWYDVMAAAPRAVSYARNLRRRADELGVSLEDCRQQVADHVRKVRSDFKIAYTRLKNAMDGAGFATVVSLTDDPVVPLKYTYLNIFIGSFYSGYWTVLMVLNLTLIGLEQGRDPEQVTLYQMENRDIVTEICRATDYMMTSSFLGPFFIVFALRCSLVVLETAGPLTTWIMLKLYDIGERHLGMAKHLPGMEEEVPREAALKVVDLRGFSTDSFDPM